MKTSLVTVGIPSYNRPLTLERTIKSIINQTYQNLEIIISDNCSTDEKVDDIIRFYCAQDDRITYIKKEKNLGATKNFSSLLKVASGEYFMWMADDDYISDDYIEKIINEFNKNEGYALIGGQGYFINKHNEEKIKNERICIEKESPKDRFISYLNLVQSNSIFYGIFRKKDVGDYNIHFYGSDWLHVARLAYKGKLKTLSNIFVYRDNSGVSSQIYSYLETRKIYINLFKYFKQDLKSSNLYNDLSHKELKELTLKTKESILSRTPPVYPIISHTIKSNILKILGKKNYEKVKVFIFKEKDEDSI